MELKGPGQPQPAPGEAPPQGEAGDCGGATRGMAPQGMAMAHPPELNGHLPHHQGQKNDSVYDFDPETEGDLGGGLGDACGASPGKGSAPSESSEGTVKHEPDLEGLEDSEMADEEESVGESFEGGDYPGDAGDSGGAGGGVPVAFECVPRRGRGRPRGSKNRTDGRGRGRGYKYSRMSEERSGSSYDLRHIPDPFSSQRRGRPRSRFIVDLGEQNHEVWTKSKEELNISDAELTTLLLSL